MTQDEGTILERCPFMTLASYMEDEYLGIIVNKNFQTVSMYIYNHNLTPELKKLYFLYVFYFVLAFSSNAEKSTRKSSPGNQVIPNPRCTPRWVYRIVCLNVCSLCWF